MFYLISTEFCTEMNFDFAALAYRVKEIITFLLCISMHYSDSSVKLKPIILVSRGFIFHFSIRKKFGNQW